LGRRIPNLDDLLQFLIKRYFGGSIPFYFTYSVVEHGTFEIVFKSALEKILAGMGGAVDTVTLGLVGKLRERLDLQEPMIVARAKSELKKDLKDDILEIVDIEVPKLTPKQEHDKKGQMINKTFG
jgi:hypothetical protein